MGKLCMTYKMCAKCCSRIECYKHKKPDLTILSDQTSINEKRDEVRRADALKSIEAAQAKLDAMKEKARQLNVQF